MALYQANLINISPEEGFDYPLKFKEGEDIPEEPTQETDELILEGPETTGEQLLPEGPEIVSEQLLPEGPEIIGELKTLFSVYNSFFC